MTEEQRPLTFEIARNRANEAAAEYGLKRFAPHECDNFLSDYYLEAEGCWYFFPTDAIEVPAEQWTMHGFAVAISKSGQLSFVYDFRDDEQKMQAYLEVFSLHCLGRQIEARAAMDVFQKNYLQS